MKISVLWFALVGGCFAAIVPMAEPSVSPDRKEIAFVSGGDIWTVPAGGGEARLLVSHPANESRPIFSPDGRSLAFVSNRDGVNNVYLLQLSTGAVRRVTFGDTAELLDSWSRDGQWLYFSSTAGDVAGMMDIWRVKASGSTPQKVSADRYASEFHAAPTPDGSKLLFVARGMGATQWWRKGRSHLDESEIWLLDEKAVEKDKQLLGQGAKQLWPQWMPDGQTFYFVSDRKGPQNIHAYTMGKGERQITTFADGRVLFPQLSNDGKLLVFERDFGIWKLDTATGRPEKIAISLRGAPATAAESTRLTLTNGFSQLAVSPDGKKLSFTAHGEVWAANAKAGGDAVRISRGVEPDGQAKWSPDSTQLVYVAEADGVSQLVLHDFTKKETRVLTSGAHMHGGPLWSPDGKRLAYLVDSEEIRVRTLADGTEKSLYKGRMGGRGAGGIAWSPDGAYLAAVLPGVKNFRNVHLLKTDGGRAQQVSWLPNSFSAAVTWLPDASGVLFSTTQRTESGQIALIELKPRVPKFREDGFRELFGKDGEKKKEPVTEVVAEGMRERVRLLSIGLDAGSPVVSPDGKTLLFVADVAGQQNLYTFPLDPDLREPAVARQLTTTEGAKAAVQWTNDGKAVYYLDAGRIQMLTIETRAVKPVAVTAELEDRFEDTKRAVFRQAWTRLRDVFYDPEFHGVDWNGAVKRTYGEVIDGVRTQEEMRRVLNLMVGELNASHSGVGGPPAGGGRTGRLGLDWDADEYERSGQLKVGAVLPGGPLALAGGVAKGDVITAVDGVPVLGAVNFDSLLAGRVGKEVVLDVAGRSAVRVRPIAVTAEKQLRYTLWTNERRELVSQLSGGRLGYVHMLDMSDRALQKLYLDLDTDTQAKEGVVIDVRNNNGGFVYAYALDVLTRKNYLGFQPRGMEVGPARAALGQRSLEKPTVLVTNQHSLSDAEDFTEGYRALGLGKVVGEPTAGWIIYTGGEVLLDGSTLRTPSTRITTVKGENMERNPRPVDIPVTRPMGESYRGKDSQLEAAVKVLLGR